MEPLAFVVCVVTELKRPQVMPLQPVPMRDQVIIVLGFDPEIGVMDATITVVADVEIVPGAVSCSVKRLVMVTFTLACLD